MFENLAGIDTKTNNSEGSNFLLVELERYLFELEKKIKWTFNLNKIFNVIICAF